MYVYRFCICAHFVLHFRLIALKVECTEAQSQWNKSKCNYMCIQPKPSCGILLTCEVQFKQRELLNINAIKYMSNLIANLPRNFTSVSVKKQFHSPFKLSWKQKVQVFRSFASTRQRLWTGGPIYYHVMTLKHNRCNCCLVWIRQFGSRSPKLDHNNKAGWQL